MAEMIITVSPDGEPAGPSTTAIHQPVAGDGTQVSNKPSGTIRFRSLPAAASNRGLAARLDPCSMALNRVATGIATKTYVRVFWRPILSSKCPCDRTVGAEGGIIREPRQSATCGVAEFGKSEFGDTL